MAVGVTAEPVAAAAPKQARNVDIVMLLVVAFQALAWIVYMGGLAAANAKGARGSSTGLAWWGWVFELLAIVLTAVLALGREEVEELQKNFLLMVSVVLMVNAQTANSLISAYTGDLKSSFQAAMAGVVMLLIANMFLIIYQSLGGISLPRRSPPVPVAPPASPAGSAGKPVGSPVGSPVVASV